MPFPFRFFPFFSQPRDLGSCGGVSGGLDVSLNMRTQPLAKGLFALILHLRPFRQLEELPPRAHVVASMQVLKKLGNLLRFKVPMTFAHPLESARRIRRSVNGCECSDERELYGEGAQLGLHDCKGFYKAEIADSIL